MKLRNFTPSYSRALIPQTCLLRQEIFNVLMTYIKVRGILRSDFNSPNLQQICCLKAEY
jgi:hypothetical protein